MDVALGPWVSVTVGVKVMVGVRLGMVVSVGISVAVAVSVGGTVCDAIAGIAVVGAAEGGACGAVKTGKLQARVIKLRTRNKKISFCIPLFYNLFCILHPPNSFI